MEAAVVEQVGSEVVEDGTEGEAVSEGGGHVLYPHILVAGDHPDCPDLKKDFKVVSQPNSGYLQCPDTSH